MKYRKLTAFALALSFLGGAVPTVTPASMTVSAEETKEADQTLELTVGQSTTASLSGYSETPSWYSTNESVATVDQNGKITAVGAGTAYVYAIFTDSMLKFQVNVSESGDPEDDEKTVDLGTITLDSDHTGAKADVSSGSVCTSSDSSVAVIDSEGNITAVGSGECTITIVSGKTTYIIKVVSSYEPDTQEIKEVELGSFTLTTENSSGQVKLNLAEGISVVWSSTDESVATVDQNGHVTAVGTGSCDIIALTETVKYISHLTSTYDSGAAEEGTVIGSVTLDNTTPSKQLSVNIPDGAEVEWSSSDESVAVTDQNGIVTAVSAGECRIIIMINSSKYIINVTSSYDPYSAEIPAYEIKGIGNSIQLALQSGEEVSEWSSSDTGVAVVDSSGKVTATGEGETIITARSSSSVTQVKVTVTAITINYGDANCDNDVNVADAVLILQALSNADKYGLEGSDEDHITTQGWKNADCSGSGDGVTGKDALAIQKYALKLVSLPEE